MDGHRKDDHILFFDRDLLRLFVHIMNRFQYELKDKKERCIEIEVYSDWS